MKVAVCVKHAGRIDDEVEFVDDDKEVDADFLEWELNEWDSVAVEAALRLCEEHGGEVLVVTVGDDEADEALRHCLAMGAQRAARIRSEGVRLADPLAVAGALADFLRGEQPDLVLCGVQSSDLVNGATGGALAGLLGLPVVSVVTSIERDGDGAVLRRDLEGGVVEVLDVALPAVLTIQTGANEPRYVTMRELLRAGDQAIELVDGGQGAEAGAQSRALSIPERQEPEAIEGDASAVARRLYELIRESVSA